MNLKRTFALAALLALVVSMTGCTDEGGGGSGGAKWTDDSGSVTFQGEQYYVGDPEHGDKPSSMTINFPATSNASGDEPAPEAPAGGWKRVTVTKQYGSLQAMADDEGDGDLRIYMISATLTWKDSDGSNSEPDDLSMELTCGGEKRSGSGSGDSSSGGKINLTLGEPSSDGPDDFLAESASVTVNCIECGFTADTKPWGLIRLGRHDAGEFFTLVVEYKAWMR